MRDLTVLVNTCDGFADCWEPFFTLFARFWPNCPYPIVLNTERRDFTFPGFDICAARVSRDVARRLTWSECLARCLDSIETPFVLYLQEDYFLEAPVRADVLRSLLPVLRDGRADVIRLMECEGSGPWQSTEDDRLWDVDARARYRIALQAALWRKSSLRGHLRMHESAWQLEVFGSGRARRTGEERVLCAARDRFHGPHRDIIPYRPTGIVKGQWDRAIVEPLFAAHGIKVDFAERGFHDSTAVPARRALFGKRLADRVRSFF